MGDTELSLKTLCPTRWVCRRAAIDAVLANYATLQVELEMIADTERGTEASRVATGLASSMKKFGCYFALRLAQQLFTPAEDVARQIQSPALSITESAGCVDVLRSRYSTQRTQFDTFWDGVIASAP